MLAADDGATSLAIGDVWLYAAGLRKAGLAVVVAAWYGKHKMLSRVKPTVALKDAYAVHVEVYQRVGPTTFRCIDGVKHNLKSIHAKDSFSPLRLHSRMDGVSEGQDNRNYTATHGLVNGEPTAPEINLCDLMDPDVLARIQKFEEDVGTFYATYVV